MKNIWFVIAIIILGLAACTPSANTVDVDMGAAQLQVSIPNPTVEYLS